MYEYISKRSADKSKNAEPSPDVKPIQRQLFTGLSANQKGKDDDHLLDKAFHEKVFGRFKIHNNPENGAKQLPKDNHRYTSDKPMQMRTLTNTRDTDNRSERGPVVQRLLITDAKQLGLDSKKHENLIQPRILWNNIFIELQKIMPEHLRPEFETSVVVSLESRFSNPFSVPDDGAFTEMVKYFVDALSKYLNEKHEVGSVEESKKAGGSHDVQTDTGGHVNVQEKVYLDGKSYISGSSRAHGNHTGSGKQLKERSKKGSGKVAEDLHRAGFASNVTPVAEDLRKHGMSNAAKVLDDFYILFH